MQKPAIGPQRRTHPLIWCAAIICALLAIVVIIIGLIVIISYLVIRPKTPSISISYANLDKIYYDQYNNLAVQLAIKLRAKNDNAKNHARFYDIGLILGFHGTKIAKLVNKPFVVEKNSSVEFSYAVDSRPILLGRLQGNYLQSSFRKNVIEFELKGKARAKWSMWLVGSIKFSLNLDCELGFFVPNGTLVIGSHCSSKST